MAGFGSRGGSRAHVHMAISGYGALVKKLEARITELEHHLVEERAKERAAIVAHLRHIASTPLWYDEAAVTLLPRLADQIEAGEHAEAT